AFHSWRVILRAIGILAPSVFPYYERIFTTIARLPVVGAPAKADLLYVRRSSVRGDQGLACLFFGGFEAPAALLPVAEIGSPRGRSRYSDCLHRVTPPRCKQSR